MTGLRKRVAVGFLSIVFLLFFSGMVSLFELSHMSRDTGEILKASGRNMELAKQMLDAAHYQNIAMIHISVFDDRSYEDLCRSSLELLEKTLAVAQVEATDRSSLDSLAFVATEVRLLTDIYLSGGVLAGADSLVRGDTTLVKHPLALVHKADTTMDRDWYGREYEPLYERLTAAIKEHMTSTQASLAPRAEQLKKNAYRAVTPVLISLLVMIATVLMLYYFMSIYCVNPLISLNRALGNYLSFKIPFAVKAECKDEVLELKEKIENLISISKQHKA